MVDLEIIDTVDYYLRNPVKFGYRWRTDEVSYDGGGSQRNSVWPRPLRQWGLNWNAMGTAVQERVKSVFMRAAGKGRSFRLRDGFDHWGTCTWQHHTRAVTGASATLDYLVIAGDHVAEFPAGRSFQVVAGANAGTYVVSRVSYSLSAVTTTIYTVGAVPAAGAGGVIHAKQFQIFKAYELGTPESWVENKTRIKADSELVRKNGNELENVTDYSLNDDTGIITFVNYLIDIDEIYVAYEHYFPVVLTSDGQQFTKVAPNFWGVDEITLLEVLE